MKWFYGPSDYNLLIAYKGNKLRETADLGWGIFGFLNRTVFYPVFNWLKGFLSNYGLIIILMTIVVRIIMSPLVYKSYVSSAKMKVIRPELTALNEKYPWKRKCNEASTRNHGIQRKAGVSMMSGCIPALLQMPIFFALFKFFPTNRAADRKVFYGQTIYLRMILIFNLPFRHSFLWRSRKFISNFSVCCHFLLHENESESTSKHASTCTRRNARHAKDDEVYDLLLSYYDVVFL